MDGQGLVRWRLRWCPKCGGDMYREPREPWHCLQCGKEIGPGSGGLPDAGLGRGLETEEVWGPCGR